MKIEDLLTLCKAGFSAEQIAAFTSEQKKQEPKQQEPKQQEPKQQDANSELLKAISALTAKIATMNIQNAHIKEQEQSVDDILASVIRPNGGAK